MKRILIIAGILIAGFFNSCQEFEDEFLEAPAESTLDESIIFSTPGLTKGAIDGIMEPMGQTNSYRGRFIPFYGFNTDAEWNYSSDDAGSSQGELMTYAATPTTSQMNSSNNAWALIYLRLGRANICTRGFRQFGNPQPGPLLRQ